MASYVVKIWWLLTTTNDDNNNNIWLVIYLGWLVIIANICSRSAMLWRVYISMNPIGKYLLHNKSIWQLITTTYIAVLRGSIKDFLLKQSCFIYILHLTKCNIKSMGDVLIYLIWCNKAKHLLYINFQTIL